MVAQYFKHAPFGVLRLRVSGHGIVAAVATGLALCPLGAGHAHADAYVDFGAEHLFAAAQAELPPSSPTAAVRGDILTPPEEAGAGPILAISGNAVDSFAPDVGITGIRSALIDVAEGAEDPPYGDQPALVPDSEQALALATGTAGGLPSAQLNDYRLPLARQQWPEDAPPRGLSKWRTTERAEYAFQFLNVVDLLQTVTALRSGNAAEANPMYGRNPSVGTLLAAKTLVGAVHYVLSDYLAGENPTLLGVWQYGTLAVMSGVVSWNMQFVF